MMAENKYVTAFNRGAIVIATFLSLYYMSENMQKLEASYSRFMNEYQQRIGQLYPHP
jgi:hypothetical protein